MWWWTNVALGFTLQPTVPLDTRTVTGLAVAGDTVVVTLVDDGVPNDILARTSLDGGLTFGPRELVHSVTRAPDAWHRLTPLSTTAVGLSADGLERSVAGGILMTDSRLPPLFSYPPVTVDVEYGAAGVWRDDGAGWVPAHFLDAMTDRCDAGGRSCMLLAQVDDVAVSDDGDVVWSSYTGWDHYLQANPGRRGQALITRAVRGSAVGAPIDLSARLLADDRTMELGARIATDASGDHVVAALYRGSSPVEQHLGVSFDAGATWQDTMVEGAASDVDYARDADIVAWGVIRTSPVEYAIDVRTSTDGGRTFGAPVTVHASVHGSPPSLMIDELRLAISRDGQVMAVVHEEDRCSPSCGGAPDVVLRVSEDGGATWTRLGVLTTTYAATYRVAVSDDGDTIWVAARDASGGSNLYRATRP
ncbi:MAG: exo-alpha-sialidase [Alphaproteobacteria bacterium]|nr:exo-alpha-sialidase [Alphaproteobacteria bacterium]MCB9697754.1 exo-alpha-sialidase [Alphaproteobacteria bacterium]